MQQQTFTDVEYSRRKKRTRREEFLNMMDKIIPWNEWIDLIKPYYPSCTSTFIRNRFLMQPRS